LVCSASIVERLDLASRFVPCHTVPWETILRKIWGNFHFPLSTFGSRLQRHDNGAQFPFRGLNNEIASKTHSQCAYAFRWMRSRFSAIK
jgi:hypothetical protein